MVKKERIINREYKTLFFDYDGTLFDTTEADKYALRNLGLRRFTPEWRQARKKYLAHIKASKPFEGRKEVFQFIIDNNIQAVHCLWGVHEDEQRQLMLADTDHQCISSPLQIIDILRSEHTSQS